MPAFVEDPALLSKSRLRSDLVAHNVKLPPAKSRKEVYVELYLRHVDRKHAAEFSSDEEDEERDDEADKGENPEEAETPDPSSLTDDDLKAALLRHGFKAGPIVSSTRALYEKKLCKLLQPDGRDQPNGAEILYSDSEEEEEEEEKKGEDDDDDDAESGAEEEKQEVVEQSDQDESSQQMESRRSLSASSNAEGELNGSKVQEHWSQSNRLDMPVVDNCPARNRSLYYTPKTSRPEWGTKLPEEPVKDAFKDLLPAETTPTGIYATRRRPIKGAAGRPVQYRYPDTPVSPTSLERREVERRLVPLHIQILVFLVVTCLLYLIFLCVDENSFSPFVALLEGVTQGGSDGGGAQDMLSEQV